MRFYNCMVKEIIFIYHLLFLKLHWDAPVQKEYPIVFQLFPVSACSGQISTPSLMEEYQGTHKVSAVQFLHPRRVLAIKNWVEILLRCCHIRLTFSGLIAILPSPFIGLHGCLTYSLLLNIPLDLLCTFHDHPPLETSWTASWLPQF